MTSTEHGSKSSGRVSAVGSGTVDVVALGRTFTGLSYPAWYAPSVGDAVIIDWLGARPYVENVFAGDVADSPSSYLSGWSYSSPHTNRSTCNPSVGSGGAIPFLVGRSATFTAMWVEVTAAAPAGGLLRLGVHADTGVGYPGSMIASPGAVATTSTGQRAVSFAAPLDLPPGLVWLSFLVEGQQSTLRSVINSVAGLYGLSTGLGPAVLDGFYGSPGWTPGVMPDPFPPGLPQVPNLALIALVAQ